MPAFVEPMLATLRTRLPDGPRWIHEAKFDGYRLQPHLDAGRVTIYTRSGLDWTPRFPTVAAAIGALPANSIVLDGELVAIDKDRADFSTLQNDLKTGRKDRLSFYSFDLLYLDGFDLRRAPLIERKRVLAEFLAEADTSIIFSEHFDDGAALYQQVCGMRMEGVVSKLANAPYVSGRGDTWLKVKCIQRERFTVVGFVPDGAGGLAKLRVARREGRGVKYIGRVGTGWDRKTAVAIRKVLEPLAIDDCPTTPPVKRKDTTWVRPEYSADVDYSEFTSEGMLRHPSFKGLHRTTKKKRGRAKQ